MSYTFPFGSQLHRVAEDETRPCTKDYFVLGVYASAVHAQWRDANGKLISPAIAVASEPNIFWRGESHEAYEIISSIALPAKVGTLSPADEKYNGASGRALDDLILTRLTTHSHDVSRNNAWLCDLLPETRLNKDQVKRIRESYDPIRSEFNLPEVTVPPCPTRFCDDARIDEIKAEILRAQSKTLITLGDVPLQQFVIPLLKRSGFPFPYNKLADFPEYGKSIAIDLGGYVIDLLPLAHPRQIAGLGEHSADWQRRHSEWIEKL